MTYWRCDACGHSRNIEEDGPVCENCLVDATAPVADRAPGEVETVARAIHDSMCPFPWDRGTNVHRESYLRHARAALDAVRSPPEPGEVETVARALMKRWIDQANATRYIGGPNTSPMVEPEEYDIDDPPDGMEEQARLDAEVVLAALDAVRVRSRDDTVKHVAGALNAAIENASTREHFVRRIKMLLDELDVGAGRAEDET